MEAPKINLGRLATAQDVREHLSRSRRRTAEEASAQAKADRARRFKGQEEAIDMIAASMTHLSSTALSSDGVSLPTAEDLRKAATAFYRRKNYGRLLPAAGHV